MRCVLMEVVHRLLTYSNRVDMELCLIRRHLECQDTTCMSDIFHCKSKRKGRVPSFPLQEIQSGIRTRTGLQAFRRPESLVGSPAQ